MSFWLNAVLVDIPQISGKLTDAFLPVYASHKAVLQIIRYHSTMWFWMIIRLFLKCTNVTRPWRVLFLSETLVVAKQICITLNIVLVVLMTLWYMLITYIQIYAVHALADVKEAPVFGKAFQEFHCEDIRGGEHLFQSQDVIAHSNMMEKLFH